MSVAPEVPAAATDPPEVSAAATETPAALLRPLVLEVYSLSAATEATAADGVSSAAVIPSLAAHAVVTPASEEDHGCLAVAATFALVSPLCTFAGLPVAAMLVQLFRPVAPVVVLPAFAAVRAGVHSAVRAASKQSLHAAVRLAGVAHSGSLGWMVCRCCFCCYPVLVATEFLPLLLPVSSVSCPRTPL